MAGTMSNKELKIQCGTQENADVKTVNGNSNLAGMTMIGSVMYLAKSHKPEGEEPVYQSAIFKSTSFDSGTIGENQVVAYVDYIVLGMTANNGKLYLTCQGEEGYGILEMNTDGSEQKFTKSDIAYVGIAGYGDKALIGMKAAEDGASLTCRKIEISDPLVVKDEFTIAVNDASEYGKVNGLHYDKTYGLFILTNHYVNAYDCTNRILLVKPEAEGYAGGGTYRPFAVFETTVDTKTYKQFNFEGIALYQNNMWVAANAAAAAGKPAQQDKIAHLGGVTFDGKCFSFKGSSKTGASVKNAKVNGVTCTALESMAMDSSGTAYILKCDAGNQYAVLHTTETPDLDTENADKAAEFSGDTCLYHPNGLTYNTDDKNLYAATYDTDNAYIAKITTEGKFVERYKSGNKQYGIAYYGNNQFILMNKIKKKEDIPTFNKAILNGDEMTVSETTFTVDYGKESSDVLQDIFYHPSYGLFFPVCKKNEKLGSYPKSIIYHVAKEDIQRAMTTEDSETLIPDFAIVLDKNPEGEDKEGKVKKFELESMDIAPSGKMFLAANIDIVEQSNKDAIHILSTLTFI